MKAIFVSKDGLFYLQGEALDAFSCDGIDGLKRIGINGFFVNVGEDFYYF